MDVDTVTAVMNTGGLDYNPTGSTGSAQSMQLIKHWTGNCFDHHKNCRTSISGWMPTRLLDVRRRRPRLVECMDLNVSSALSARYTSLSHCWGGSDIPRLTKSSLVSFLRGRRPFQSFLKTFQDAILVTRALGIDFIWIDSLCIIQDSQ